MAEYEEIEITSQELAESDEHEVERVHPDKPELKVSKTTNPKRLAKTIVGCFKDFGGAPVELYCVLQGSLWQAVKAIILVKQECAGYDVDVYCTFGFMDPRPVIDGKEKTGIKITVHPSAAISSK